jgi:branched-chain amino acid transport system permease protein
VTARPEELLAGDQTAGAGSPVAAPVDLPAARPKGFDRLLLALALVVALLAPWILHTPYWLNLLVLICIYAVVNQSWNLIMGYAGIWSFGQLALFGVGAYTSALMGYHYGISPFVGTIAGAVVAVLASMVLGLPSLRLRGAYVVLLTLAFHELLRNLITNDTTKWTGGGFGLFGFGQYGLKDLPQLDRMLIFYYAALILLVLTNVIIWRILVSPLGLAFRALRDAEPYAVARGIPEYRFKLLVFAISAFFTGLAGAFYANFLDAVGPSIFDFGLMMNLLAMIVIGGWGTFWGPMIGTILLLYLNEVLRDIDEWRVLIVGLLMILFVILLPQGLIRPLETLARSIRTRLGHDHARGPSKVTPG